MLTVSSVPKAGGKAYVSVWLLFSSWLGFRKQFKPSQTWKCLSITPEIPGNPSLAPKESKLSGATTCLPFYLSHACFYINGKFGLDYFSGFLIAPPVVKLFLHTTLCLG